MLEQVRAAAEALRRGRRVRRRLLVLYCLFASLLLAPVIREVWASRAPLETPPLPTIAERSVYHDPVTGEEKPKKPASAYPAGAPLPVAPAVEPAPWRMDFSGFPWALVGCIGIMSGGVLAGLLQGLAIQKRAARTLATFDDVRAVGPLVEALAVDDGLVQQVARGALMELFPRLKSSDGELLETPHRAAIQRELRRARPELAIAVLKGLEQVGDDRDLPAVEELAAGGGTARRHPDIRAAAEECLPLLRLRGEQARAARLLLRPSAMTDVSLLRPAAGEVPDPALLLHPAE